MGRIQFDSVRPHPPHCNNLKYEASKFVDLAHGEYRPHHAVKYDGYRPRHYKSQNIT